MLIVDVGTNAEIVLGDRQQVLVASSPTGPAFEGAQITHGQRAAPGAIERVRIDPETFEPRFKVIGYDEWIDSSLAGNLPLHGQATGICGSGIIEAVAELYLSGLLNADGLFVASLRGTYYPPAIPGQHWRVYPGRCSLDRHRRPDRHHTKRCACDPTSQGCPVRRDEAVDEPPGCRRRSTASCWLEHSAAISIRCTP